MGHAYLRFLVLFFFAAAGCWLPAAADEASDEPAVERMRLLDDERPFSVGDRMVYQVTEERETPAILFVNARGMVDFPLIGEIPAVDKTAQALALEVKEELEKEFFYRATVLIRLQDSGTTRGRVNLVGATRRQGQFAIPSDDILTVSRLILEAGGLPPEADGSKVRLVRHSGEEGAEQEFVLNVEYMLQSGDFSEDMAVQRGDLVVVPERENVGGQYIVDGAVNSPGLYNLPADRDLTVSKAILQAGGFSRFANQRTVQLIRGDESLPPEERSVRVNVRDILENNRLEEDPVVRTDDIIRIDEKLINF